MPINKVVERKGSGTVPYVVKHPEVRGGVCERCGVIDSTREPFEQYKLCEHYRGVQLRCTYCPNDTNHHPDEVARRSVLKVFDSPTNPNELVVVCDEYACNKRHEDRFKMNA